MGLKDRIAKLSKFKKKTPAEKNLAELILEGEKLLKEDREPEETAAWQFLDQNGSPHPMNLKRSRFWVHLAGSLFGIDAVFPLAAVPDLLAAARKSSWKGNKYELLFRAHVPFLPSDQEKIERIRNSFQQIYPTRLPAYAKLFIEANVEGLWTIPNYESPVSCEGCRDCLKISIPLTEKKAKILMEKYHVERIGEN